MGQRKIIVILSGEIAVGKSTLTKRLQEQFAFKVFKTRDYLKEIGAKQLKGAKPERDFFQKLGAKLDKKDNGKWVLEGFQEQFIRDFNYHNFYIVDSARILDQVKHFRHSYSYAVCHIHLTASPECIKRRFLERAEVAGLTKRQALEKYKEVKSDPTETQVPSLAADADLVFNTELCTAEDVFIRVASVFQLLSHTRNKLVDVIVGAQFGSEGKGQIAAHIAPDYDCLIRVGGPNAGHTVYEEPQKHVFHLLPSGSWRNQNAKLIMGPGSVINVEQILNEINKYGINDESRINKSRLTIDENAIIITAKDIEEEQKIKETIGSTGQGVGYATANNIIERLRGSDKHKAKHHPLLKNYIGSSFDVLEDMYRNNKRVLLEGTQGTGLSIHHGIYPFVTSRDTTVSGCLSEAGISPKRVNKIIMVTRTYPIRVGGNSGPFISNELDMKIIATRSGKNAEDLIAKEKTTTTGKDRRIAEFSWSLFRKACELNSPTDIALTFADYFSIKNEHARRYDQLTLELRQFIEEIERCSGVNVSLISTCFDYRAIIDRRNWK